MKLSAKRLSKIFLCLCSLGVFFAAHAAEKIVIYGDDDYAPYSYVEDGQFKGIYVNILQEAARQMAPGYLIDLQPIPWKRGLLDLERGRSFALFPPGRKSERAYIQPYSVALYRETVVLFCTDKVMSRPHANFPDDYLGLTVGVNLGFLLSDRLMQASTHRQVILDAAKGNETNLKKLARQRIDCYASDRTAAQYSASRMGSSLGPGFALREAVELSGEDTFIAYSANNNPGYKADFVRKLNTTIELMKKQGAIKKIGSAYLR
ncbi:polar amino acid transport system substrate-binding protein [Oxalobacteraceae bacterium GrIS 2.11]